jgi:uncharacterized integral membrane protein (TIGR00697 family)
MINMSVPGVRPSSSAGFSMAALILVSFYIAAQMLSDVASLKIGVVFGLAVDMGTFIYPVTFTLRDVIHRAIGKRGAQAVILTAGAINLLMAGYLQWAANVPSDASWGMGEAFASVLAPVWRIVIASIVAEVFSELADTEVYHWWVTRITRRHAWARVVVSNSVSVPVDNLIFCVGAFAGRMPWSVVAQIFIVNLLVKWGMTIVSIPLIYLSKDRPEAVP